MRVLNVNSSLDPKVGGGTAERTFQMSRFLAGEHVQCVVLTLNIDLNEHRISALLPATVVKLDCIWKRFYLPQIRWKLIRRLVNDADIIHLMGHWSLLNAIVYLATRVSDKPYVVCPAGALPLFGRSKFLKRIYNLVIGKAIIRNASAWIAVTSGELPDFVAYGIRSSRITVIPNGISEDDFPLSDCNEFLSQQGLSNTPVILFMGRLNLIKGPDLLLKAFILVRERIPNSQLVFVGPDGGMLPELQELVDREGLAGQVHFLGYLEGHEKSAAYRCARLLVVPSRQEAMSIVALEAGICGTPVLLTDQCGFSEIRLIDERFEVPATINGLADGLIRLLADPKELKEIAPVWQQFVAQKYAWQSIISQYIHLYSDLIALRASK